MAATVAVDALSIAWYLEAGPESLVSYLVEALTTSQLAVVCLWATFGARRRWMAVLTLLVAVLVCTAIDVYGAWFSAGESFGMYTLLALAIMVALWFLKRARLWAKISHNAVPTWQFSVGQVLLGMTVVGLLITALRGSELVRDEDVWKYLAVYTMCDVAVVLAATVLWAILHPWPLRLCAILALALAAGMLLTAIAASGLAGRYAATSFAQNLVPNSVYTILISLVLFLWLELSPIVPINRQTEATPSAGNQA